MRERLPPLRIRTVLRPLMRSFRAWAAARGAAPAPSARLWVFSSIWMTAAADVVLGDEDVVVEEVTDDGLGSVKGDADGDALGEGGGWGVDEAALFPGQVGRESGFGGDTDDFEVGPDGLACNAKAGCEASATDGDDYHLGVREVLQDFDHAGPEAGNEIVVFGVVEEAVALLVGDGLEVVPCLIVVCAVGHKLGAEVADGLGLAGVGIGRQSDDGVAAEELASVSHGLAKVASRCNGNAFL